MSGRATIFGKIYRPTFLVKSGALEKQPALKKQLTDAPLENIFETRIPPALGGQHTERESFVELAKRGRELYRTMDEKDSGEVLAEGGVLLRDLFRHPVGKWMEEYSGPVGDALQFAQQFLEIVGSSAKDGPDDYSMYAKNSGIQAFLNRALLEDPFARKAALAFVQLIKDADSVFQPQLQRARQQAPERSPLKALSVEDRNLTALDPLASELKDPRVQGLADGLFRCAAEALPPEFRDDPKQLTLVAAKVLLLFNDDTANGFLRRLPDPPKELAADPVIDQTREQVSAELAQLQEALPQHQSVAYSDWLIPADPQLLQLQREMATWASQTFTEDHTWKADTESGPLNGGRIRLANYHFNTEVAIGALIAPEKGAIFKRLAPTLAGRIAGEYKTRSGQGFRDVEGGSFALTVYQTVAERLPALYRKARHGTLPPGELMKKPDLFQQLVEDTDFMNALMAKLKNKDTGRRSGDDLNKLARELVLNERVVLFNTAVACHQHREGMRLGLRLHQLAEDYLRRVAP